MNDVNTNEYKEKCLALAKIYQEAGETGRPVQRINCVQDGYKNVIDSPTQISNLALYRVKPAYANPMEKYIITGLDMQFSDEEDMGINIISPLIHIDMNGEFINDTNTAWFFCRLRSGHIHWWCRSAENPIPDNCKFRVYSNAGSWTIWRHFEDRDKFAWDNVPKSNHNILAFEIRYI